LLIIMNSTIIRYGLSIVGSEEKLAMGLENSPTR
jgi:hypothetical protein